MENRLYLNVLIRIKWIISMNLLQNCMSFPSCSGSKQEHVNYSIHFFSSYIQSSIFCPLAKSTTLNPLFKNFFTSGFIASLIPTLTMVSQHQAFYYYEEVSMVLFSWQHHHHIFQKFVQSVFDQDNIITILGDF